MKHLDEMTCVLYLEGQLDRTRAQELMAHTQECGECKVLLRALERESRLLTRAMLEVDEPLPARLAAFQERARRSLQWVWMVTFGLAASGIYAVYTSYVEPMQQRFEQAGFGGTNLLGLLIFQGAFWKGWQSMISLVEVLALLTMAGCGALVFRRWRRRGSAVALIMAGLCAVISMFAVPAGAVEVRKGETVEVRKDENIKGDMFFTGHRISVAGTVDGDVYAFSQDVEVSGHITGDLITGAQTVRVSGTVDGNIRGFSNTVTIAGTVGRNLMAWAQVVNIDPQGKVGRSVTTFTQTLGIEGNVGGDVVAFNQTLRISGTIGGGIEARGERLVLESTAVVNGPVKFEGKKPADVSEGAKLVFGPVQFSELKTEHKHDSGVWYYFWRALWSAAFVLYGLVLIYLMPSFSKESSRACENVGASLGIGVLAGISTPIAAALVCATVIGIPLGIASLMLWLTMIFTAQVVVGTVIGRWILGPTEDLWGRIGRMALGIVVLGVIVAVLHQIAFVEFLFKVAIALWGFGALGIALYKRFRPGVVASSVAPAFS